MPAPFAAQPCCQAARRAPTVSACSNSRLEQDVGSRLRRWLSLRVRFTGRVLRAEIGDFVWCHKNDDRLRLIKRHIEDFSDVWGSLARQSDGLGPLDRLQADRTQELEHLVACLLVTPVHNEHLAGVSFAHGPILAIWADRGEAAARSAGLMVPEAAGAAAYWAAWASLELRWAKADEPKVPDHWRTLGGRASPLPGNPRSAANPANALLNYVYGLVEASARLTCLAIGLDPGLGVLHADLRARDSLALDVMEAVRPDVDTFVLELIRSRTFRPADFSETRQGVCRIVAPLTHELLATMPTWEARLAPVVESVARTIATGPDSRVRRLPTLLTGANRSAGRDRVRVGGRPTRAPDASVKPSCRSCGGRVPPRGRGYCEQRLPARLMETRAATLVAGNNELARLRAQGQDPSHGGAAGSRRGTKVAASHLEARQWERSTDQPPDPAVFHTEVLPRLAGWGR